MLPMTLNCFNKGLEIRDVKYLVDGKSCASYHIIPHNLKSISFFTSLPNRDETSSAPL